MEDYRGEELIIMDGIQLSWEVLEKLTDTMAQDRRCGGWQRGQENKVILKGGSCRNIIYFGNKMPQYDDIQLFDARFIMVNLGSVPKTWENGAPAACAALGALHAPLLLADAYPPEVLPEGTLRVCEC